MDFRDEVRKLFRALMGDHGFKFKGNVGYRWLSDMQQSCRVISVGFLPWLTIDYSIRLFRTPDDARKPNKEFDVFLDVRELCGMTEGTLWSRGLNLEDAWQWSQRVESIQQMVEGHLIPHLEILSDRAIVMDIIRYESVRRKFRADVSLEGYELIGGYANHVQDVEES